MKDFEEPFYEKSCKWKVLKTSIQPKQRKTAQRKRTQRKRARETVIAG